MHSQGVEPSASIVLVPPWLAERDISERLTRARVEPSPQTAANPLANAVRRPPRHGGPTGARETDGESVRVSAAVVAPKDRAREAPSVSASVRDTPVGVLGGAHGPSGNR